MLKWNTAMDEEEEQHSEKDCITGVAVATGHHASLYMGGSVPFIRGLSSTRVSKLACAPRKGRPALFRNQAWPALLLESTTGLFLME